MCDTRLDEVTCAVHFVPVREVTEALGAPGLYP